MKHSFICPRTEMNAGRRARSLRVDASFSDIRLRLSAPFYALVTVIIGCVECVTDVEQFIVVLKKNSWKQRINT